PTPRIQGITSRSRDSGYRIATESAPVAAWAEQPRGRPGCDAGSDREAVAQAFGYRNDVGSDALVDMDAPAAAATYPGLDLIHPQQGAMLIADFTSLREIALGRDHNA